MAAGLLSVMVSCSMNEDINIKANNSIDRDLLVHLDTVATGKLVSMAAMMGQPQRLPMDSLGIAWDSVGATISRLAQNTPGVKASYTPWNRQQASGAIHLSLPDINTYNQMAGNTLTAPDALKDQVPLGGMHKQQLTWITKDTLQITLDNSKSANAAPIANEAEVKQAMGMVKMLLGIDAVAKYKANIHLPKAAKSVTGANAVLSADKKTVTLAKSLDEANPTGQPDIIKVVF